MAGLGRAWQGEAGRGKAWHGGAWLGKARRGGARYGAARLGQAWLGKARQGEVMQRFTVDDLKARGFELNYRLSSFYGFCGWCATYRGHHWWQSPPIHGTLGGQVSACDACGHVHQHDAQWARRNFPLHLVVTEKPGDSQDQTGVFSPSKSNQKPVVLQETAGKK